MLCGQTAQFCNVEESVLGCEEVSSVSSSWRFEGSYIRLQVWYSVNVGGTYYYRWALKV
jgi:hypothetical protein